jgi:hypothetical protein
MPALPQGLVARRRWAVPFIHRCGPGRVDVKPKVTLKMANYTSRSGVYYRYPMGRKVVAKGSVAPNHARLDGSTIRGTVTIRAYKRTYSSTTKTYVWKSVKTATRTLTSSSTYGWSWYPKVRGNYKLRTTFPGDTAHLKAVSVYRYVRIY